MAKDRIAALEAEVRRHQDLYYNGQPEIDDASFDRIWDELKALDPGNAVFSEVGRDRADGFEKVVHLIPMGSQEKAADPDGFRAWAEKQGGGPFLVQFKMDGASIELQYRDGNFVRAVTRGNGKVGDDVSANVRRMKGVPASLADRTFSGGVRGEVLMAKETLASRFPDMANCRNAANGIMKRKDAQDADALEILCYDAMRVSQGADFSDERDKLAWLASQGFETVRSIMLEDAEAVIGYRFETEKARDGYRFDIDGLVVKRPEVDAMDAARARPERQIAFKFSLEEAVAKVLKVEWSESGASFTPVAILEPVKLCGTTVQRASLANPGVIRALGLKIGSRVIVVKRGEIIPKIEAVVGHEGDSEEVRYPERCSCGSALVDEDTRLFCPNPACPKKALHRLQKWVLVANLMDFGDALLARLYEIGAVRTIPALYALDERTLSGVERMGETLARKLLRNLKAKTEFTLSEFVAGFDIEGIGETLARKAVEAGFDTLDALRGASVETLTAVDGFGEITATTLLEGLAAVRDEMDELLASGEIRIAASSNGPLAGKSFCFTGEMATMKRSEAEAKVKALGGTVKSSVAKGLYALVTNDPGSGSEKNVKAAKYGVAIITERDFLALLEDR
jgi:DNA ligase (NAD+)